MDEKVIEEHTVTLYSQPVDLQQLIYLPKVSIQNMLVLS